MGEARHTLDDLSGKKDVKFRIAYGSDATGQNNDGIAFDDIRIGARTRKVLLEHFTNLSSVAGSNSNTTVSGLATRMKADVINIQYHTNFPEQMLIIMIIPVMQVQDSCFMVCPDHHIHSLTEEPIKTMPIFMTM